ncbi:UDP-Glc/Gal endoplasmic reticulum nucleotide sugar transporter [Apiospora kogelbergensis]|uniref:UDP-Glc/Gal endoplasmic reticulum nucleotide sugar transporter n=1 Tax=Apiospora kogelbergensis TaxID=1337665 RepID=UPI003130AA6D
MARTKQVKPIERQPSSEYVGGQTAAPSRRHVDPVMAQSDKSNGALSPPTKAAVAASVEKADAGVLQLVIAVAGIYGSLRSSRRRPTGPPGATEVFKYPVFLNTIQSLFAATTGAIYLYFSTPRGAPLPAIFPSQRIVWPLLLVALTSSLASPFGYASLAHIDYITFLLAKSCKLLPVMFLHITVFRKRYPLYKYLVVAAVTAGVAVFTLHSGKKGGSKKHATTDDAERNMPWGLLLLSINLLFDGLTNSTQDYIFSAFQPYTGPQMMCANNLMSTAVTAAYLILSPWLVQTGIGEWLGMDVAGSAGELGEALQFMARNPSVWADVLGFAACGAVGQVFIFYTLSTFSSVLLVTVTVTRKMFTMILSVVAFGHRLTQMQVLGVGLVFGGIGVEAAIARQEKMAKEEAKRKAKLAKAQ